MDTTYSTTIRAEGMVYSHNLTLHLRASDYAKHFHNDCEFLYFIDGAGEYVVEERRYRVTSGDLMLIPPGKYHFLDAPDGRRYERFVLHASPAFFSDPTLPARVADLSACFLLSDYPLIREALDGLIAEEKRYAPADFALLARSTLERVMLSLLYTYDARITDEGENSPLVMSALGYISEHLSEIKCADDVARGIYASVSTLMHGFQKQMQIPLMRYVRIKKILEADRLLSEGVRATEAAERAGFSDYTAFYRLYRHHFGRAPRESRARRTGAGDTPARG